MSTSNQESVEQVAVPPEPASRRGFAYDRTDERRGNLGATPRTLLAIFLLSFLGCLVTTPETAVANNGSVALAYQIGKPIQVDGDLSDWPDNLPVYPVNRVLYGNTLRGYDDFSAEFRTAYQVDDATLYVAVTVHDDAHCNRHNEGADHVIISLGKNHGNSGVVGPNAVHYGLTSVSQSDGVHSAMRIEEDKRHYEFRFDLREFGPTFAAPATAFTCSFTAEIWDIDDDGTQSYITWSPDVFKMIGADRHGDLILGVDPDNLIRIRGRPVKPSSCGRTIVRLRSQATPHMIADIETDAFGQYDIELPAGPYYRSAPQLPAVAGVTIDGESSKLVDDVLDYGDTRSHALPLEYALDTEWLAGNLVDARPDELPRPRRIAFGKEHGLPSAWIRKLSQDRNGTIWMATENGLHAQDGVRLRSVELPSGTAGRTVFATTSERGEEIWFGCEKGVYVLHPDQGEIRYLSHLAGHEVLTIGKSHDGTILLGTNRGMFRRDPQGTNSSGFRFVPVLIPQSATACRIVQAFAVSAGGDFTWVGTDSGLFRFDGQSLHSETMPPAVDHRICELFVDSNEQLWLGTGCSLVHCANGHFRTIYQQDQERLRYVRSIVELQDKIVVAAYDGILHLDRRDPIQVDRTESPVILTAFVDQGENFWFTKEEHAQLFCDISGHEHHAIGNIHALECQDDMIWYTSKTPRGWFLHRYSAKTSAAHRWRLSRRPTQIVATNDGPIIGTVSGLLQFRDENLVPLADTVLSDQEVYDLKVDSTDCLWVVCRGIGKVFRIVDGVAQRKANLFPLGSEQINWILPQLQGCDVAGTHQGLSFCREGDLVRRLSAADGYDGMISSLAATPDGTIWFSTTVGLYSSRDGSIARYKSPSELESVYHTALENGGDCWSVYRHGIGAVFGSDPIAFQTELDPGKVRNCARAGDTIWYSTTNGLFRYEQQERAAPTLCIDRITCGGSVIHGDASMTLDDNLVRIEFHAILPSMPADRIVYQYRLKGFDNWQRTQEHMVEYTELPVGEYSFEVQAISSDLQSSGVAAVPITVSFPYARYATTLGLLTSVATILCLVLWHFQASRVRTKQLKQQVEEGVRKQVALLDQLRNAQRLESLGTLAAGISHDFNNTLQAISMTTELAMLEQESSGVDDLLSEILLAARQAGDLTRSLLTFARKTTVARQPTQLGDVLTDAVRIIRRTIPANIQFHPEVSDPETWCRVDPSQIQQAIMNLCINARDAMPDGGTLTLDASRVIADGVSSVRILVADTGHGIPEDNLHRVFEPFFTEKPREKGTGLGLSITHGIVTAHEGTITIHSVLNVGTEVEIRLPTCSAPDSQSDPGGVEISGHGSLVLLADDQATVREGISELLRHHEFRVLSTQNGTQALTLARTNLDSLHAVILDVDMPGMNGIQVMHQLRADGYQGRIVIMTGLPSQVPSLDENSILLKKPFSSHEVISAIGAVPHVTALSTRNKID